MTKKCLNSKEAAKYLGMAHGTFDKLKGQITAVKYPGVARVWYDVKDLDAFVEANKC